MKRRKLVGACLLFLSIFLLSACGKEEVYQPEVGIGGYVYVAEQLQAAGRIKGSIKVMENYVYYARQEVQDGMNTDIVVERFSLEGTRADGKLQVQPETVLVLDEFSRQMAVPDYIADDLQNKIAALEKDEEQIPSWGIADDGSLIDISKVCSLFSFRDFDVDTEGNIYYLVQVWIGRNYEFEAVGNALICIDCSGEAIFKVYYPDISYFVLREGGGACILGDGQIYVLDEKGTQIGEISTEHCRGEGKPSEELLMRDAEGHVYYGLQDYRGLYRGFELLKEDSWELQEISAEAGEVLTYGLCASSGRKLLYSRGYEQFLYEYNMETGEERQVLEWVESGFINWDVISAAWADEGRLLMLCDKGIYLLSETPVEELPEKETIILFSAGATDYLNRAVIDFNRENSAYRVIIDDYGVDAFYFGTMEADTQTIDLAIVSKNPPDILDMTFLDLEKYTRQGVLEDLSPYLEESSILKREDFLENALEGITVDGCLTCIPANFRLYGYFQRTSQLGEVAGWGMEDVYRFTDGHPESVHDFMEDIMGVGSERDYLLGKYCADYCLEKFVDWERNECRFDSGELGRLLDWVEEYSADPSKEEEINSFLYISENALLATEGSVSFLSYPMLEAVWGEEITLVPLPSADGKGKYTAAVVDALAITSNSAHKEGAWAFLEYYLSQNNPVRDTVLQFPVRKDVFSMLVESVVIPGSERILDGEMRKVKGFLMIGEQDRWVSYPPPTQEQVDDVIEAIQSADFTPRSGRERMILRIISEEAESYYNGDKSIEEVTRIIQNRVNLLLQEG